MVPDKYDLMTNKGRILTRLKRLQSNNCLLSVLIDSKKPLYTTVILEINEKKKTMVLDAFNADQSINIMKGSRLTVMAKNQGIDNQFEVEILKIETRGNLDCYHTPLPSELRYYQQRETHRVPVIQSLEGKVTIFREEGAAAIGELQNLSASGFGGTILNEISLEDGREYPCYLEIGFMPPINATIEIKFLGLEDQHKHKRFGANFRSINLDDRQSVEKAIQEIQRQIIRKGVKTE